MMLYDFGRMNLLSSFLVKLAFVAAFVGCALFSCIALAIAVRLGNAIIGF